MNIFDLQSIDTKDLKAYNPQVLAFVGDAVYSLYVRNIVATTKKVKSGAMHKMTSDYVKATKQSADIERILPLLTDDELAIYKRGRNYKTQSVAKHSTVQEYKRATGFEAVIGYLYLSGDVARMNDILKICVGENQDEN